MDLQNKYQILASEFSKVRGQVTVLKKAVLDEQNKNHELQDEINRKDQNLRRNAQEIETLSFLNTQLKSRLEILQHELQGNENVNKSKKTNSYRTSANINSHQDDVLAQELLLKIQQYEAMHRRANEFEKQLNEQENERIATRSTIEQLQNQMSEMQESHQRSREEFERIFKQLKQENDLLNEQVKQHLIEPTNSSTRTSSILTSTNEKISSESSSPTIQAEIFLYKYLTSWHDAFTELTIYIEERVKTNPNVAEKNEKMSQTVKTFHQQAEHFLSSLKIRLFNGKSDENTTNFAECFSMFVSSCEKILSFAIKSICDEPKIDSSTSESQEKIYQRIEKLNENLHQYFHQWSLNLCQLREISVGIIQLDSSLPNSFDRLQEKINEIFLLFQSGSIIHCDLDKTYNDKLCLEYELNASPVHLTTTDECILAALRKLATLEQQICQLIRENRTYLFEYRQREKSSSNNDDLLIDFSEDSHQQMIDVHKKQILSNAEAIGVLEQEKEHWRLEYQLLKIKFEKMRDDLLKEIDLFKEKTKDEQQQQNSSTNQIDSIDQREYRRNSDEPNERELMIKQYYSQKIVELEKNLQLANGKGIAFYNELANIHQRLRYSKDQEAKARAEIEHLILELNKMKDELATTTKRYEEQIGAMSEYIASMTEQVASQNEKMDKLQQQLHLHPKETKKSKK